MGFPELQGIAEGSNIIHIQLWLIGYSQVQAFDIADWIRLISEQLY